MMQTMDYTGIPGELGFLHGVVTGNRGAVLRVRGTYIRPYRFLPVGERLHQLVRYCLTLSAFRRMPIADVQQWLTRQPYESPESGLGTNLPVDSLIHITLQHLPTNLPTSIFQELSGAVLDVLHHGVMGIYAVESPTPSVRTYPKFLRLFPLRPNQYENTANHSLVLRKSSWQLVSPEDPCLADTKCNLVLDACQGIVCTPENVTRNMLYLPYKEWVLAIPRQASHTERHQYWHQYLPTSLQGLRRLLLTVVRHRPHTVQVEDLLGVGQTIEIPADVLLCRVCDAMVRSPATYSSYQSLQQSYLECQMFVSCTRVPKCEDASWCGFIVGQREFQF